MSDPYRARLPEVASPEPLAGRRPRLLADLHLYQPQHNAGAEVMVHAMLRACQADGWEVRVIARDVTHDYTFDGVDVVAAKADIHLGVHYGWCDVVLTHLDTTRRAVAWARNGSRPVVHVVHNHRQLNYHRVPISGAALVVWNSEWIAEECRAWRGPSMVVRPHVSSDEYATDRTDARDITLVNLTAEKGAALFWRLARLEPERSFLGIKGAYGTQIVEQHARAQVWENGPDARAFLARTRVLLAPASYESWGRAAVEALASGIPVLAHPTPGLRESLGPAGIFLDRNDTEAWRKALAEMDDPKVYVRRSRLCRARSAELDALTTDDLARFVVALDRLLPKD